jgi:hypothetical protein
MTAREFYFFDSIKISKPESRAINRKDLRRMSRDAADPAAIYASFASA